MEKYEIIKKGMGTMVLIVGIIGLIIILGASYQAMNGFWIQGKEEAREWDDCMMAKNIGHPFEWDEEEVKCIKLVNNQGG